MDLARLSWPDAREAIRSAEAAVLAVGATEQHGPHLPVGTDWFIASAISEAAAQRPGLLLLPGLAVGVSAEHRQFWGTLSVSPDLLRDAVVERAGSVAHHGLARIVLVNGHGSNVPPLRRACRELREDRIFAFVFN